MKKVKIMGIAAFTGFAMLLGFTGCENPASSSDSSKNSSSGVYGVVSGIVTESIAANGSADGTKATDAVPVAGATVTMGQYHTTTNESGVWVLDNVIPNSSDGNNGVTGSYTAVITKDGFVPTTVTNIQVNPSEYVQADPFDEDTLIKMLNDTAAALGLDKAGAENGGTLAYVVTGDSNSGTSSSYIDISTIPTSMTRYAYKYSVTTAIAAMCPLSAGIKGTLNISSAAGADVNNAVISAVPKDVDVYFAYTSGASTYTFGPAKTDDKGVFMLSSGLPVGQTVTVSVPGFNASVKIDATTTKECFFSSEEVVDPTLLSVNLADTKETVTAINDPIILYAQPTKIVVTAHNVGIDSVVTPLSLTAPITFTFDRPMADLTAVFGSGDDNSIAWDSTHTTATITPKTLSGMWTPGATTVVLSGKAQDGTTKFAYSGSYNVEFIKFEFTKVEVVDSTVSAARAVSTSGKKYLAITFNETVDGDTSKTFLKFDENTGACVVSGNTVYVPFGDAVNNSDASLTGQVTSASGSIINTWSGIDSYYNSSSYKITAVSWFNKDNAINKNNNSYVYNLSKTDAVTITFSKAFDLTDIATAELYNTAPGSSYFTEHSYDNTAAVSADGTSITITPVSALEAATTYYIALKVTDSTGATTKFTTANYTFYYDLNNAKLADSHVVYSAAGSAPYYLTFTTKPNPSIVYAAQDVNTKTTTKASGSSYELDLNDPLVLQFDQDVTGYKFYLTRTNAGITTSDGYSKDVVTNASDIIKSSAVTDGKIVTVTPETYYAGTSVYAYVYGADDKYVTVSSKFTVKSDTQTLYSDAASAGKIVLTLKTPSSASKIDSTSTLTFIITPVQQADGTCPTYSIYKAVMQSNGRYTDWAATGSSGTPDPYKNVKRGDQFTLSVANSDADYDWGTPKYMVIAVVNNLMYASSEFTASDKVAPLYVAPAGTTEDASFSVNAKVTYSASGTYASETTLTLDFVANDGENAVPVHLSSGTVSGINFQNLTHTPTVTGAFTAVGTYTATITVPAGGSLITGDTFKVTLKDTSGNTATAPDDAAVQTITVTIN